MINLNTYKPRLLKQHQRAIGFGMLLLLTAAVFYWLGASAKDGQLTNGQPSLVGLKGQSSTVSAPTLPELQSQVALLKDRIDEINLLKERFADLSTPRAMKASIDRDTAASQPLGRQGGQANSAMNDGADVGQLLQQVARMNERLLQTESLWLRELNVLSQLPTGSPIENNFGLSSNYGSRMDPFSQQLSYHAGVDFSAPAGTSILATGDGKVIKTDFDRGLGQYIEIEHASGFTSKYAHLKRFHIRQGELVKRGQVIGEVGSTGRSTSPHLHYEISYQGTPINPMEALAQRPVRVAKKE